MKCNRFALNAIVVGSLLVCGCDTASLSDSALSMLDSGSALSLDTIAEGLKEALIKGTGEATTMLSSQGGYANNSSLRIPLPDELTGIANTMKTLGLGSMVTNLENKMNTGAEQAAAMAKPVFWKAIKGMSFADAKGILSGGPTAATDYFKRAIGGDLRTLYLPIVEKQLNSVGAVKAYSDLVARYAKVPFVKKPSLDLNAYATDKALDGLFSVIAAEEKSIRENPAARTSALLRKVFGQ